MSSQGCTTYTAQNVRLSVINTVYYYTLFTVHCCSCNAMIYMALIKLLTYFSFPLLLDLIVLLLKMLHLSL